jgi:hypothetical protein
MEGRRMNSHRLFPFFIDLGERNLLPAGDAVLADCAPPLELMQLPPAFVVVPFFSWRVAIRDEGKSFGFRNTKRSGPWIYLCKTSIVP